MEYTNDKIKTASSVKIILFATFTSLLIITFWLKSIDEQEIARANHISFDNLASRIEQEISRSFKTTLYGIKGGAGIFAASQQVDKIEFQHYVESRELKNEFPGVRGFGVVKHILRENETSYVQHIRDTETPDFKIKRSGTLSDLFLIQYVFPQEFNAAAWGLDIGFEKMRRTAVETCVSTGTPQLTGIIKLVQDNQQTPGFLLLLPVYKKNTINDNAPERWKNLDVIVYSPIVANELLNQLHKLTSGLASFKLFESHNLDKDHFVFGSDDIHKKSFGQNEFSISKTLHIYGRNFTLQVFGSELFISQIDKRTPMVILFTGILLSSLMTVVMWLLILGQNRAFKLAEGMTKDLSKTNNNLEITNKKLEIAKEEANDLMIIAEKSNESKSSFLANMSHEIRTPLNGVIGMSTLLLSTPLDDEQKQYASVINDSSEALLVILNDILDFSKIEAGKIDIENAIFDINSLLQEINLAMSFKAREKDLAFHSNFVVPIKTGLVGDSGRLRQIIYNIIGNAIKFTHEGSIAFTIDVQHESPDTMSLRFSIKDSGIGIPQDKIERLFKTFSQIDESITRRFGGTGLGLAISKQLVNIMGGQIGVNSIEHQGTEFWFTLDFGKKALDKSTVSVETKLPNDKSWLHKKNNILLVEDNITNQLVAKGILKNIGLTTDIAVDGQEALDKLQVKAYDLIFMDMQMPVMDGIECTRHIRENKNSLWNADVVIVAMTANVMKKDINACFSAGMNAYIPKPIISAELLKTLQKWLPDTAIEK